MNNPVSLADWNGEEPGQLFGSEIAAALDFALYYNGTSIVLNREYASCMYVING